MKFNNRENKCYTIDGKQIWASRSVAVNCTIIVQYKNKTYVLISKRGPSAADNRGRMNLIAGYMDWDENGTEACFREGWEECGVNISELCNSADVVSNNMHHPWFVNTKPTTNRQNISLSYGLHIALDYLPELTTEYNEVEGEVEDPMWIQINDIDTFEWAFGHDRVIREYLELSTNKN